MGTSAEDDKEVIKCLLCQGDVEEAEMIDHIASKHLGYTLHRCEGCDFGCHNAQKALEHAQETRHPVMLNKVGPILWSCAAPSFLRSVLELTHGSFSAGTTATPRS
jgi:hypothetical protein